MLHRVFLLMLLLALPAHGQCVVGAWRIAGGMTLDISPAAEGGLRWRSFDGATGSLINEDVDRWASLRGWSNQLDGHRISGVDCEKGQITFDRIEARRVPLEAAATVFESGGVRLIGRLVLPKGAGPHPLLVLIQGSEENSARELNALQRLLPSEGVGVFVYDKRGTGASGGSTTQDFDVLAGDAVAALEEARRMAGRRVMRAGFFGISLGGWVAPIAASRTNVDFVIVASGLAISPLEQNRAQVAYEMELKGHGESEIAGAMEIAHAAERIVLSEYSEGFTAFDEVRTRYRDEPWYKDVHGNYLYRLMPYTEAALRSRRQSRETGTPWLHDPMPVLEAATTPQLWLLAEDDIKAPSGETARRIARLREDGRPFTLKVFPHAGHGMLEYETSHAGKRTDTRYPEGYFAMIRDYAMGKALSE